MTFHRPIKIIEGQTIVSLRTRKTMYDQDNIVATTDDGHEFMIKVDDLLPIISEFFWEKKKARKHTYIKPLMS